MSDRRSSAASAGGWATRGGPEPPTASRHVRRARCRACEPSWSGVRRRTHRRSGSPPRRLHLRSCPARRGGRTSRFAAARPSMRRTSSSRSCTTPREATRTRGRRLPPSCAGYSSSTSSRTAGTTSATTFSSTASARSTRAGTGASTATSWARTRSASTPARWESRFSGPTATRSHLSPHRTRSRGSSHGGSISRTSTRLRPSLSSREEARDTHQTPRSRSAQCRAIATRARRSARGTRSTRG